MPLRITGRREDSNGANTHYRLSDGRIVIRADAVAMQKREAHRRIKERNIKIKIKNLSFTIF